jgi:hypothetical protein
VSGHLYSQLRDPDDLNGRLPRWIRQPHRNEVQVQHTHQSVEQSMKNMGWIAATPDGRNSEQADKIVNARLKVLDLSGGMFGLDLHIRQPYPKSVAI